MLARGRRQYFREFNALQDVSFEIRKGEAVGIIGRNGSGKSTLLQLICGTLHPSHGQVEVHGRVAALLELGAGFNPEFTGRENVYLGASLYGLTRAQIDARFASVAAFAEIGEFIDRPVKTYSSGMYVRLAFSVAISVEPDILVIDEALAVGDVYFVNKCMRRIEALKQAGVTILFVSHDTVAIASFASSALWLERGRLMAHAPAGWVVSQYLQSVFGLDTAAVSTEQVEPASVAASVPADPVSGWVAPGAAQGRLRIRRAALLDEQFQPVASLVVPGRLLLEIEIENGLAEAVVPLAGYCLADWRGIEFSASDTDVAEYPLEALPPGESVRVRAGIHLPRLHAGRYLLVPSCGRVDPLEGARETDRVAQGLAIEIQPRGRVRIQMRFETDYSVGEG